LVADEAGEDEDVESDDLVAVHQRIASFMVHEHGAGL